MIFPFSPHWGQGDNYISSLLIHQRACSKTPFGCLMPSWVIFQFLNFAIPWTVAHQTLKSKEFPRLEYCSGLSFPSLGDLLDPETKRVLQEDSLPLSHQSVQLLSHVWLFVTQCTAALQASLSITNSRSLFKFMSIESVMPSNHPILCRPLLLLPSISPKIRVFSNESALCIRWPKYWSFSFSISLSNEYSGLISFRMD